MPAFFCEHTAANGLDIHLIQRYLQSNDWYLAAVLVVWLDVAVELVHELVEQFFAGRNKECGRG